MNIYPHHPPQSLLLEVLLHLGHLHLLLLHLLFLLLHVPHQLCLLLSKHPVKVWFIQLVNKSNQFRVAKYVGKTLSLKFAEYL